MSKLPASSLDLLTPTEQDSRVQIEFLSMLQYAPVDMVLVISPANGGPRTRYSIRAEAVSPDVRDEHGRPCRETFLPPVPFLEALRWIQGFRKAVYLDIRFDNPGFPTHLPR